MDEMNNNNNDPTNGCGVVPPGFRFHPTEEELVGYYLTKRIHSMKIDLDVIVDIDLYNMEPWDIQDKCNNLGHCYDDEDDDRNEWYFFSHKDKKYPTGTRTNRATAAGFWKATGRDKAVHSKDSNMIIGMRKTLVFYKGRAPNGRKTDWIMHEYRLQSSLEAPPQEEGWVVCRAFKKPIPASNSNGPIRPIQYTTNGTGYDEYPYWTTPPNHNHNHPHHHNMMSAATSTNPSSTSLIIIPESPNPPLSDDTNNNNIGPSNGGFPSPLHFMIRQQQQQQNDLITNYNPNSDHHSRPICNDGAAGGGENHHHHHYDQVNDGDPHEVITNSSWKFLDSLLGSNNNSTTSNTCGNDVLPDPTTFFLEQQQEVPPLNYNDVVHEHEEDALDRSWK